MKRSSGQFERRPQDVYLTPASAIPSLLPFITGKVTEYAEPCAALKTDEPETDRSSVAAPGSGAFTKPTFARGADALTLGPLSVPIPLPTHLTRDR